MTRRGGGLGAAGTALLAVAVLALTPGKAAAQLISPGKLARPHAALEGLEHCTECHELGKQGVDDARCLKCHEPLARRIAAKQGLHATYTGQHCADCHKDHFGPDFALVRLDSATFDHAKTGYRLRQAHDTVACRSCHRPENIADAGVRAYAAKNGVLATTDLGLTTACAACHHKDDPHGTQFARRGCDDCHDEATWKKAPAFAHDRTRYPLTGAHATVPCDKCHTPERPGVRRSPVRYAGLTFAQCTDCHTDPHHGVMRGTCASCHNTASWHRLQRTQFEATFDHSRTKFPLAGAHARAKCGDCHQPRAARDTLIHLQFAAAAARDEYPPPAAANCLSCHVDAHHGEFARAKGGATCDNCHGQEAWQPTTYDIARHNRETTYVLTGAHLTVPCEDCHVRPAPGAMPQLKIEKHACADCHLNGSAKTKNPHGDQFASRGCLDCHVTATFKIAAFDHSKTRYPLDGAHRRVPCASCHKTVATAHGPMVRYRPLPIDCRGCHGAAG